MHQLLSSFDRFTVSNRIEIYYFVRYDCHMRCMQHVTCHTYHVKYLPRNFCIETSQRNDDEKETVRNMKKKYFSNGNILISSSYVTRSHAFSIMCYIFNEIQQTRMPSMLPFCIHSAMYTIRWGIITRSIAMISCG